MAVPAFAIIIGLTHLYALHITSVTVSGNTATASSDITNVAEQDIAGNYFHLFSRSNICSIEKENYF